MERGGIFIAPFRKSYITKSDIDKLDITPQSNIRNKKEWSNYLKKIPLLLLYGLLYLAWLFIAIFLWTFRVYIHPCTMACFLIY